jgi:hypothetical protein
MPLLSDQFEPVDTRIVKSIGQWGKFRKPARAAT